ncbi:MAG: hypothetical protein L0211_21730 [Planctomycetaceae bacterium]|nr:hypothetical protein [Planctomycetaceae bacterium]
MPWNLCLAGNLAIAVIIFTGNRAAVAQSPSRTLINGIGQLEGEDFSIEDVSAATRHLRWREVAINDSKRILLWRLEGKLNDPEGSQAAAAARLLGSLRAGDHDAPSLLCKNLTLVPGSIHGTHWSDVYVSALALIQIGGPKVATAVINHVKHPRAKTELLLLAQVLHKNDSPEITFARFQSALREAKLQLPAQEYERFAQNIAQLTEWLRDPQFDIDGRFSPLSWSRANN